MSFYPRAPKDWDARWAAELVRALDLRDRASGILAGTGYSLGTSSTLKALPNTTTVTLKQLADFVATMFSDLKAKGYFSQ